MKKILFLLIVIINLYSGTGEGIIDSSDLPYFKDTEGRCYKKGSLASTEGPDAFDFSDRNFWNFSPGIHRLVNYVVENKYMTRYYYYYSSIDCSEYPAACTDDQVSVNGSCETIGEQGSCPEYNIRASDGSCVLEMLNYETYNRGQSDEYIYVYYADGSRLFYEPATNWGWRFDENGNDLPLVPIVGTPYDGKTPSSFSENIVSDGIGKFFQFMGLTFFTAGVNTLSFLFDVPDPSNFNPAVLGGLGLYKVGQAMRTPDTTILQTNTDTSDNDPLSSNTIFDGVTLVSAPVSNDIHLGDVSQIPDTPDDTPVDINDNFKALKSYSDDFAKSWGGRGELGDVVYFPKTNENVAITAKDEKIKVMIKNDDGSIDVASVDKTEIQNSIIGQSNGLKKPDTYNPVNVSIKKISPPIIQNDGSVTRTITKVSTVTNNPETNQNEKTDETGSTTVTQISNPAGTPTRGDLNSSSINFEPVTNRLENMSRQLNKANSALEKINSFNNAPLPQLSDGGGLGSEKDYNISFNYSFLDNFLSMYSDTWENLQNDLGTLKGNADTLISSFNQEKDNGFGITLPHSSVETCPYTSQLDLSSIKSGWIIDINIDLCKPFSKLYPVFYVLFSILFTVFIIVFSFKSLIRLL